VRGSFQRWFDPQVTTVVLGIGLVVSCLSVLGLPFPNEDLFVAFCSGRDAVRGLLGEPNRWSYAIPTSVWVDQSWLAHLLFYVSYVEIGAVGPIVIKGGLVAAVLVSTFIQCVALGAGRKASIVALTLAALAMAPFANIRAHLFGMLSLVILAQLLTLSSHRNRLAQIGSVVIIALWSNVHGSFMLGFFLLVLRAFVEVMIAGRFWWTRRRAAGPGRFGDAGGFPGASVSGVDGAVAVSPAAPIGWLAAVATVAAAMAFFNPYGPENLMMPFRQFFGTDRTVPWKDWLALLHQGAITDGRAFRARSAVPVLVFLGWISILLTAFLVLLGAEEAWQRLKRKIGAPNSAMEILLPLTMVPLMFKFGRLVIFAVPLLVPAAAVLMTAVAQAISVRYPSVGRYVRSSMGARLALVLALLWVTCTGFLFYRNVVVPLLPDNPLTRLRSDAGISSQLLSYNLVARDVAEFMNRNHLSGRVFSNLYLANYLLLEVPETQVFVDLRAHSAYPAKAIETYSAIMGSHADDLSQTVATLESLRVEHVVLDTCDDECRGLLNGLLSSGKWGCIYQERNGCIFVLARAESSTFRSLLDGSHENTLWYETPEDRAIAESVALLFARGSLPLSMRKRLESIVQSRPDPGIYVLIAGGSERPLPCLDEGLRNFFLSEFHRLSKVSYLVAGGMQSIVMSAAKVAEILEADGCKCSDDRSCVSFSAARRRILQEAEDLIRRYHPL